MNQKIIIIGDTHANFEILEKIYLKENSSGDVVAILHAGDMGVYDENSIGVFDKTIGQYSGRLPKREIENILRHNDPIEAFLPYLKGNKKFPVPVYNIAGNHEDFVLYNDLQSNKLRVENFIPLKQNQVYTINFANQNLKIAGLGKIISRAENNRKGSQYITDDEYAKSWETLHSNKIDIFLLHEPPSLTRQNKKKEWISFGNAKITKLLQNSAPSKVFIGHMHFEYTYKFGKSEMYGLGYGFTGKYAILDSKLDVQFCAWDESPIHIQEIGFSP